MLDSVQLTNQNLSDYSDIAQIIIGLITVIIGFLTFRLAMKVHREFIKNHAKSTQVKEMSTLLEFLNKTKIYLTFTDFYPEGGAGGTSYGIYYNIFEIGSLLNNKEIHKPSNRTIDFYDYDDCPVFLDNCSNQIMNIKEYLDNSFIPKKIADKLLDFYVITEEKITYESLQKIDASYVILNSSRNQTSFSSFKQTNCEAMKSWLNLKTYSNDLAKEIGVWFKSNGIDDYNLRIDYKNIIKPR